MAVKPVKVSAKTHDLKYAMYDDGRGPFEYITVGTQMWQPYRFFSNKSSAVKKGESLTNLFSLRSRDVGLPRLMVAKTFEKGWGLFQQPPKKEFRPHTGRLVKLQGQNLPTYKSHTF